MRNATRRSAKKVRTTITLPKPVYEEARSLIDSNAVAAESMNDFFEAAVTAYLKQFERREIDAQFAAMSTDPAYQQHAESIAEEFRQSDWEAFEKFA